MDLDQANPRHLRLTIATLRSALIRATHQFDTFAAADAEHVARIAEALGASSAPLHADIARVGEYRQGALQHAREGIIAAIADTIRELGQHADSSVSLIADLVPRRTVQSEPAEPSDRATAARRPPPAPHKLVMADGSMFVGTVHMTDPDDDRSVELRRHVHAWLEETQGAERIFLVEGRRRRPMVATEREAMSSEGGEMTWATWVADEHDVPVASLEEDQRAQVAALLEAHERDSVFAYYVLRQIPQALRAQAGLRPDPRTHLRSVVDRFSFMVPGSVDALDHFGDVFEGLYPERPFSGAFGPQDEDFLLRETTDVISGAPVLSNVQHVAKACNHRRDAHAAFLIRENIAEGRNVCALLGGPHFEKVVAEVPAFRGQDVLELRPAGAWKPL